VLDAEQFKALGDVFGVHAPPPATITAHPQRGPDERIATTFAAIHDLLMSANRVEKENGK
jgi:hypothetical protein